MVQLLDSDTTGTARVEPRPAISQTAAALHKLDNAGDRPDGRAYVRITTRVADESGLESRREP